MARTEQRDPAMAGLQFQKRCGVQYTEKKPELSVLHVELDSNPRI